MLLHPGLVRSRFVSLRPQRGRCEAYANGGRWPPKRSERWTTPTGSSGRPSVPWSGAILAALLGGGGRREVLTDLCGSEPCEKGDQVECVMVEGRAPDHHVPSAGRFAPIDGRDETIARFDDTIARRYAANEQDAITQILDTFPQIGCTKAGRGSVWRTCPAPDPWAGAHRGMTTALHGSARAGFCRVAPDDRRRRCRPQAPG